MVELLQKSPQEFIAFLRKNKIHRFYFIYDHSKKKCIASHSKLDPIANFFNKDKRDYLKHEGIFGQIADDHNVLYGAFIHKTCRGQGAGGVRFWPYDTLEDFLRDGIRLATGMTRKNALADLWWGGGKGLIAQNPKVDNKSRRVRNKIFQQYGEFISSLRGNYITAEDVGTTPIDVAQIYTKTRFVTCVPEEIGGSGNPSFATAKGVIRGMQAALKFLDKSSLKGKTVVVQGAGHVGSFLIGLLFKNKVAKVIANDIDKDAVQRLKKQFKNENLEVSVSRRGDLSILATECDILAPCATGAILNPKTIKKIKAKIVCGAANSQLEDPVRDDKALFKRKILYVPDFLVNRMGIVNCANEQYGYINQDTYFDRHLNTRWKHSVYQMTMKVLKLAQEEGTPPNHTAIVLADELAQKPHPIYGHRGQQIINSLVEDKWHEQR